MANLNKKMHQLVDKVNQSLSGFFDAKLKKASAIDSSSVEMLQLLKNFTLRGGKRIRAALLYHSYKGVSKKENPSIMNACMAIELIHAFLLIHDDIIDRDRLRRGALTIHAAYEQLFKNDKERMGISFAILAGDILYAFANELLSKVDVPAERKTRAIAELNHIIHQVIYGQALDILSSIRDDFTAKDLEKVHYLKTATYTVEGPLRLGAILAGANASQLKALSRYAIPLGKAFQLQDDILGLFGDEKTIGKPVGSDIKEGKKTLLILKALELASEKDRSFLKKKLGKKIGLADLERIRGVAKGSGSLAYSQNLIRFLTEEAKKSLPQASLSEESRKFLISLADNLVDRRS